MPSLYIRVSLIWLRLVLQDKKQSAEVFMIVVEILLRIRKFLRP